MNIQTKKEPMNIRLIRDGLVIATAILDDNSSARDFLTLLPLTLTLQDYAQAEKIADLPRALALTGAAESNTPRRGDISFYAPWGNLAIFYADGKPSPGLVQLGRLDAGIDEIRRPGPWSVRLDHASS